eukprot:scaffold160448_cov27-Tisochrysis_lutea.AAC.1
MAAATSPLRQTERENVRAGSAMATSPASESPTRYKRKRAKSVGGAGSVMAAYKRGTRCAGAMCGRAWRSARRPSRTQRSEPTCSAPSSAPSAASSLATSCASRGVEATSWKTRARM